MKKALIVLLAVAILGGAVFVVIDQKQPQTHSSANAQTSTLRDGNFTGSDTQTPYGNVQIAITVSGGSITDVEFLKMPDGEDRSREITAFSKPQLKANTIKAQNAQIDFVTGATSTSYGYQESLQAALDAAVRA